MCTHLSDKEFRGFALDLLDWLKLQRNHCVSALAAGSPGSTNKTAASGAQQSLAASRPCNTAAAVAAATAGACDATMMPAGPEGGLLAEASFDLTAMTSGQLNTLKGYYTKLLFLMSFCCQLLVTDGTSSSSKEKKGETRRFRRKSAIGLGGLK